MNYPTLKKTATILLIILFFTPLIATAMLYAGTNSETQQYAGLQVILMGAYNTPFLLVSMIGLAASSAFHSKLKESATDISFAISIGSSVVGSILMLVWGLG